MLFYGTYWNSGFLAPLATKKTAGRGVRTRDVPYHPRNEDTLWTGP